MANSGLGSPSRAGSRIVASGYGGQDQASGGGLYPSVGEAAGIGDVRPARVLRVLIVDDNVGLAENIAEILDGEGYATQIAGSAEEALTKAREAEFKLLVTDFKLPGLSGVELIQSLRLEGQEPRAVVISAHMDDRTMNAAQDVGAHFLGKPVDLYRLNRFLRGGEGLA